MRREKPFGVEVNNFSITEKFVNMQPYTVGEDHPEIEGLVLYEIKAGGIEESVINGWFSTKTTRIKLPYSYVWVHKTALDSLNRQRNIDRLINDLYSCVFNAEELDTMFNVAGYIDESATFEGEIV